MTADDETSATAPAFWRPATIAEAIAALAAELERRRLEAEEPGR